MEKKPHRWAGANWINPDYLGLIGCDYGRDFKKARAAFLRRGLNVTVSTKDRFNSFATKNLCKCSSYRLRISGGACNAALSRFGTIESQHLSTERYLITCHRSIGPQRHAAPRLQFTHERPFRMNSYIRTLVVNNLKYRVDLFVALANLQSKGTLGG